MATNFTILVRSSALFLVALLSVLSSSILFGGELDGVDLTCTGGCSSESIIAETFPSENTRALSDSFKHEFASLYSIVNFSRRWDPGSTLLICFYGGKSETNRRIVEVARQWLVDVNLK